jgi:hypothetical protein
MHQMVTSMLSESEGGVEEKKEDDPLVSTAPSDALYRSSGDNSGERVDTFDEPKDDIHARIEGFARSIIGSCGQALSCLAPTGDGGHCRGWVDDADPLHDLPRAPPQAPLSIADELRKLATKEGRVFGGGMRRADIPRFLGEEAVYSFDDDNISAISQHTLEEMARHGIRYPVRRRQSSESLASSKDSETAPPKVAACSTSTRSSKEPTNRKACPD